MNKRNNESWRDVYLRLMEDTSDDDEHRTDLSQEDLRYLKELCDEGFMYGKLDEMADGKLAGWTNGLTLKGRLFYDDQKNIKFDNSIFGRLIKVASLSIGWVSGVISAYVVFKITNT